ncbi:MAG: SEL1-like repeat protein [Alphaproteobacteria bacterium]|nr:SEL1-like repeat protein [Alphaproteobacteria bacterium]
MKLIASLRLALAYAGVILTLAACTSMPADFASADAAAKRGDHAAAISQWKTLADYGYPEAQLKLGQAYAKGNGVEADPKAALAYFEAAAAKKSPAAYVELAQLYEKGKGVEKSTARAEEYYLKAAALKFPRGFMGLGKLYEREKDYDQAMKYYKAAADMGVAAAEGRIAKLEQKR